MRSIRKIVKAEYRPIGDLITYSPMPTGSIDMIDPFIFLNHHGPQTYKPNNKGLPFGPHPHRGMETVTFILDGDISHKDSSGNESVIGAGGVQWMTAGSGLIHAEVSSEKFKEKGGPLEILQLWVNLPAKLKMGKPWYKGLQNIEIPVAEFEGGKAQVVSGEFEGTKGAFQPETGINLALLFIEKGAKLKLQVPENHNILCYVIKGELQVNGKQAMKLHLVDFGNDSPELQIEAIEDSTLLFGHAKPFDEPVVARGPFVMNTMEEINQAYADYQSGKFGSWKD
ncbi:pirin family protein [Salegentibacter sediminis]|uniref:pirin family protein n=1 Tax=Salegentibacter sediminis TaxID=1930251 RepID=UPI0009BD33C7|nr:pirin family protein [Salegentibacter sediminis]